MATSAKSIAPSKTKSLLARDEYGALPLPIHLPPEKIEEVKKLLAKAAALPAGIPASYSTFGKKEFECLNHDVYDVLVVRGKVRGLIVQARYFWKHLRKTRTRLTKTYYLISATRNTVTVEEIENATCAKRAKNTTKLGQLVGHYLGTTTVKCSRPVPVECTAYKVLAKNDDGDLVSAFDGSVYKVGEWRAETAKPDHGGGYYCYFNADVATSATKRGATFHQSVSNGKRLVLCEVEVSGGRVIYDSGKIAVSKLRVLQEICLVEIG
jgi:hypothetical protein